MWAKNPAAADIYPGIFIGTDSSACTTNFLFTSTDNRHIYLGAAAHCFTHFTENNFPCDANTTQPMAPGTPVYFFLPNATYQNWIVEGTPVNATYLNVTGVLVYNSWYTMLQDKEPYGSWTCGRNDFALVEIPLEAQGRITPAFPKWGNVTSILQPEDIELLMQMRSYGHSSYWLGQDALHEKQGYVTQEPQADTEYWYFLASLASPGFYGDSGSAIFTADGRAAGIFTYWAANPAHGPVIEGAGVLGPGTGTYSCLSKALDYLHTHTDLRIHLAEP